MHKNNSSIIFFVFFLTITFISSPAITIEISTVSIIIQSNQELDTWKTIPASEAKAIVLNTTSLFIVDVRTQDEYDKGHVEGAILIPYTEIATSENLPEDKSNPILVYCRSGSRSAIASQTLEDLGYTSIWNIESGLLNGWIPAGYFITISVTEASNLVISNSNLVIIDVRSQQEYNEGHIGGAILIPLNELNTTSSLPVDKESPIIVYCHSGLRSAIASQQLEDQGYTKVMNMEGGFNEWLIAGFTSGTMRVTTNDPGFSFHLMLACIISIMIIIKKRKRKK
ncbi:MAG: rhodanese-like domain-containing protein [Candidatus Hodarchaeales archaeon]